MGSFDQFWNLYDLKKSREKVERKWYTLSVKDQQACMDSLPQYIKSTPDKTFRKHPATYLNQKCWNDKIYNEEEKPVYREIPDKPVSDYQAKPFDRSDFIQMLRDKFKAHFETGVWATIDHGGTIHNFLTEQGLLSLTDDEKADIELYCIYEQERPRERTESPYIGSIKMDIKSQQVKKFLENARKDKIKVFELI